MISATQWLLNVIGGGSCTEMKQHKVARFDDTEPTLQQLNHYLEENFPDFFAEARFQVGDDDYSIFVCFGQYLAQAIEQNRASARTITRGFALLNNMAAMAHRNPQMRKLLVLGALEYIFDAPKARALARVRLSPEAQGYLESLCE